MSLQNDTMYSFEERDMEETVANRGGDWWESLQLKWFPSLKPETASYTIPKISNLKVEKANYIGTSTIAEVIIMNDSDVEYILHNKGGFTFHEDSDVLVFQTNSFRQ